MRRPLLIFVLLFASESPLRADEAGGDGKAGAAQFIGSSKCATSGCHGNPYSRSHEAWKSSFVQWKDHDPHFGAFNKLFSDRSKRMVKRLVSTSLADNDEVSTHTSLIADKKNDYRDAEWRVIETRCIGCHATPAPHDAPVTTHAQKLAAFSRGVSCESCHGAASLWLAEHDTTRWKKLSPAEKAERGLKNTRDLSPRAALCVDCHVGPRQSSESDAVFDVTHELIAAGHPRLEFEFSAYLANLPPHWNEKRDRKHNGEAAFQFHAWRVGQLQMAQQLAAQLAARREDADVSRRTAWPEFANYNCFDCHHTLRHESRPSADRLSRLIAVRGRPESLDWPFAQLQIVARASDDAALRALDRPLEAARGRLAFAARETPADQQRYFAELHGTLVQAAAAVTPAESAKQGEQVLKKLLAEIVGGRAASYERVVQFQLALAALVDDREPAEEKRSSIGVLSKKLETYLDACFTGPQEQSIYHSPDRFQFNDPDLRSLLQAIAVELESLLPDPPAAKK